MPARQAPIRRGGYDWSIGVEERDLGRDTVGLNQHRDRRALYQLIRDRAEDPPVQTGAACARQPDQTGIRWPRRANQLRDRRASQHMAGARYALLSDLLG